MLKNLFHHLEQFAVGLALGCDRRQTWPRLPQLTFDTSYRSLLGLEVVSRPPNGGINLGLSDGFLGVYDIPDPGRVHHFCIGVDDFDADRVKGRFDAVGWDARVSRNPAARTSGGGQLYFSDPDGTLVQLGHNGYQG